MADTAVSDAPMSEASPVPPTIAVSTDIFRLPAQRLTAFAANTHTYSHVTCASRPRVPGYGLFSSTYTSYPNENEHNTKVLRCEYRRVKADGTFLGDGPSSYCEFDTTNGHFQPSSGHMTPAQETFERNACQQMANQSPVDGSSCLSERACARSPTLKGRAGTLTSAQVDFSYDPVVKLL